MKYLKVVIEKILELLYPSKCPFCGRIWPGICEKCREDYPAIREPRCMKCGKPISKETEEYCYDCKQTKHYYEFGRSLWVHKKPVSEAIYAFKYKNQRVYGEVFARELAKTYGKLLKQRKVEVIIPIPLHKSRRRERGYNQTEILAEYLGKYTGIEVDCISLARVKRTSPQKCYNNKERKKNIKNAFVLRRKMNVENVVLIDDIYTTGSTIDEAARILKEAGVINVYFLTISVGQGY